MFCPHRTGGPLAGLSANGCSKRQPGFTLLELLVALVILSIMAAMATPAMSEWRKNSVLRNSTREISQIFRYARSEAIARNATISVLSDGTSGDDWTGQIQVFVDADGNGNEAFEAGDNDVYLKSFDLNLGSGVEIESNASAAAFVSFSSKGNLDESGAAASFGVCDSRGNSAGYSVAISNVGRVVTSKLNGVGSCDP